MLSLEENLPFESCLRDALSGLDARSRDVIYRRYGLVGEAQTLREVSAVYRVTSERVRLIETKALRLTRQTVQRHWSATVQAAGLEAWQTLSGDNGFVLASDARLKRQQLSPWLVLALDVCEMKLEDVLDSFAQRFARGWIAPDWPLDELIAMQARLEQRLMWTALPCTLAVLMPGENAQMVRAVLALTDHHLFGTYVAKERLGRGVRRALRLHAMLANSDKVLDVTDLARRYRIETPTDPCTARDCEIVMGAQKHLFLEVADGCWTALGPAGEVPTCIGATDDEDTAGKHLESEDVPKAEPQTIAENVAVELRSSGPSRISRLKDRAPAFLPPGRSEHGIGRILVTRKDMFVRPLPGIYALHDQVPSPAQLVSAPPRYMFQDDQVRLYALARRAGEPWRTYPLWVPESEYLWCVWARQHSDPEVFESLLSVAQIDAWPEFQESEVWRELARTRARFSLQFPPGPEALVLPPLDRVLAACAYIRQHGTLGWISGNRILLQNVQAHRSAGLLAALVALRIVAPDAEDWQAPHREGPLLQERYARLEAERRRSGKLDWKTDLGRELQVEAVAASLRGGWVSPKLVQELFG